MIYLVLQPKSKAINILLNIKVDYVFVDCIEANCPEEVFIKGQSDLNPDFKGRSISVGDVIIANEPLIVSPFGFKAIDDKLLNVVR